MGVIKMIKCCKDCKKRQLGCHSTCKDYIREKSEHDNVISLMREQYQTLYSNSNGVEFSGKPSNK